MFNPVWADIIFLSLKRFPETVQLVCTPHKRHSCCRQTKAGAPVGVHVHPGAGRRCLLNVYRHPASCPIAMITWATKILHF